MAGIRLVSVVAGVMILGGAGMTARGTAGVEPTRDPVVLRVIAAEYSFEAPMTTPAGPTRIEFTNNGREFHHAWLVRLDGGHTRADFEKAMSQPGPLPSWAVPMGGPNAPAPGGTANATLILKPGSYLWVCAIPGADGQPHAMKGMVREMTVTAGARGDLPKADAAIILSDYAFDLSKPLTAGKQRIRLINYSAQPHEIEILRILPGNTVDDVLAWLEKLDGEPKAFPLGGVAPMGKGMATNIDVEITPGTYLLICFVPDAADGKPHFMHGMTKVITVS